jgi:hypothetical protein
MKDFVKSVFAYLGAAATAFAHWVQAQAWITNTVGLLTIIYTSMLIIGWFKKQKDE